MIKSDSSTAPATTTAVRKRFSLRVIFVAAVLLVLTASSFALYRNLNQTVPGDADVPAPHGTSDVPKADRPAIALITRRPTGFEPSGIALPPGRVFVIVDNRAGIKEMQLELDREGGDRPEGVPLVNDPRGGDGPVRRVRVPIEKLKWRGVLDLSPGTYVLRESPGTGGSCRITVTG